MPDALGYIRVSSEEQADSGLGLVAQRQRIAAYCAMKGLRLAEVFEDPGISGGKPLASRPAGSQLLAAAKKNKAPVIVAKLDRLFRSVADAANVIADFDKRGIQLVAIADNFDMTSPYGRAMAQMASVFAELERAMIRERTRSAMSVKRPRGERISGYAPFGWDFGRGGRLVPNAREQKVIAHVRRLRAEGLSYRGIATRLESQIAAKLLGNLTTWPRYNFVNPGTPPICLAACLRCTSYDRVNRRTAATHPRYQASRVYAWHPTNAPNPIVPHLGHVAQVDGVAK